MIKRNLRSLAAALLGAVALLSGAAPALAHEGRGVGDGDLVMVVGFGTEPAIAGQPNSVQLILEHDGKPVVDLGDTLGVEVSFGDQTTALTLEPFFEVGEFGTPGDYRAWFIPTRPGQYSFHFSGTIDGEEVDETFESSPETFSEVESPGNLQFPVQDPTTGELAERIEREVPRLNDAIEQVGSDAVAEADRAGDAASQASDDAASARTLGMIGLVVGALGLVTAIGAIMLSRRRAA